MRKLILALASLLTIVWSVAVLAVDVDHEQQAIKAATAVVAPAVVQIETIGGLEKVDNVLIGSGPTTGLIVDPAGYIISSAFNFVHQPPTILVTTPAGKKIPAEIVANDRVRMLVLLKVNTDEALQAPLAVPKNEIQVGQWAIAVGRTYDIDVPNVSVGIVSAVGRVWSRALQTDAKVSPVNYGGPLIDIRGQVLGVLVPMSPQNDSEIAGADLYDSGIGFAIPLEDVYANLERLKRGVDLHPGRLGITLKSRDPYGAPPVIGSCPANSPAAKAGLRVGDELISVDGVRTRSESQLKHQLGPHPAGDVVTMVARRGPKTDDDSADTDVDPETITAVVTLVAEVDPYDQAFLGILPLPAADTENGVAVRFVFPDSPAAAAGIVVGDRLLGVDGTTLADVDAWRERLAETMPGDEIVIDVARNKEQISARLMLARVSTEIPTSLPPRRALPDEVADDVVVIEDNQPEPVALKKEVQPDDDPATIVKLKLTEVAEECLAIVPDTYDEAAPHGVIIWLAAPGEMENGDELRARWSKLCRAHDLIVMAPSSSDESRWRPIEVSLIRKYFQRLRQLYKIDSDRVAAHGYLGGGSMAYVLGFLQRDLIRGVAPVEAAIPSLVQLRGNDPLNRLAFLIHGSRRSTNLLRYERDIRRLEEMKFPVNANLWDRPADYLSPGQIAELAAMGGFARPNVNVDKGLQMSGPTAKSPDRYIHRVKDEVRGVLVFVGVIWGVFLLDRMFPFSQWFGLTPRSVVRIPGIVLMPFLHHDLGHLLGNTVTLVVLLTLLAGSRARSPAIVGALILASGGLLWLFGRNGTPDQPISHVGASGLIFGLITFLIASGIFERRLIPLAISGLVGLLYGGTLLWNVLPGTGGPNTSWDGHLLGAIAGVVVAYLWTRPTPISDLYPRVVESTAKASEGGE